MQEPTRHSGRKRLTNFVTRPATSVSPLVKVTILGRLWTKCARRTMKPCEMREVQRMWKKSRLHENCCHWYGGFSNSPNPRGRWDFCPDAFLETKSFFQACSGAAAPHGRAPAATGSGETLLFKTRSIRQW